MKLYTKKAFLSSVMFAMAVFSFSASSCGSFFSDLKTKFNDFKEKGFSEELVDGATTGAIAGAITSAKIQAVMAGLCFCALKLLAATSGQDLPIKEIAIMLATRMAIDAAIDGAIGAVVGAVIQEPEKVENTVKWNIYGRLLADIGFGVFGGVRATIRGSSFTQEDMPNEWTAYAVQMAGRIAGGMIGYSKEA